MYEPIVTASIVASEGYGKTEFLWTLPPGSHIFHIDSNTEESFEAAVESEKIARDDYTLHQIDYPATVFGKKNEIQELADKAWEDQFIEPLRDVLDDKDVRAIGLDTGTELFELLMMADHGRTIQVLPEMRTKTNYKMKGLLGALKRSKKHVVLLHRARAVYESKVIQTQQGKEERREKVDGVYEREGFSKVGFHVNVEAFLTFDPTRSEKAVQRFGMRIDRCTPRPGLITRRAYEKDFWKTDEDGWYFGLHKYGKNGEHKIRRVSFPFLATLMYPNTDIGDWL